MNDFQDVMDTNIQDPFQVFPEELWELILEKCESTDDILRAFPQLKSVFRGRQFFWRIGEILPLIFPKLISFKDIKNCRCVSIRWKHAVDKCLEKLADLAPSSSDQEPESHFNYRRMPCFANDFLNFLLHERRNPDFYHSKTIWATYNPFPGRSVYVSFIYAYTEFHGRRAHIPFRMDTEESLMRQTFFALESVGHHIRHVSFKLPEISSWQQQFHISFFIQYFVQCLELLPNVKSVKLVAHRGDDNEMPEAVPEIIAGILDRSKISVCLEILDLCTFSRSNLPKQLFGSFLAFFVYHSQVRKLIIYAGDWKKELAFMLPNLAELCLHENPSSSEMEIFRQDILAQLDKFPYLQKLVIKGYEVNVYKILKSIPTHSIQSIELSGEIFVETFSREPVGSSKNIVQKIFKMWQSSAAAAGASAKDYVWGLRILKMKVMRHTNFRFLRLLPCLQILYLYVDSSSEFGRNDVVSICLNMVFRRRQYSYNTFKYMWNAYPNLTMITVETADCVYQCVREEPGRIFKSSSRVAFDAGFA